MSPGIKFSLWLGTFFGTLVALVATAGALLFTGLEPARREALAGIVEDHGPLLAFMALLVFISCGGILRWLFGRFVAPLRSIAEQAVIVATANPEHRVASEAGPEVAELARAINRLGDAYRAQQGQMDARIAEAGASLAEERNRLAALMSELSEGVLVCNEQGRILLYNERARAIFAPAGDAPLAAQSPVGLGRPIFAFLDRDQVAHAIDKVRYGLAHDNTHAPVTMMFTPNVHGDMIRVRFAPFLATDGAVAGLVLTCEDVTRAFGQESQRRSLLQALATRVRRPAANVRAAAENLTAFPDMSEADRRRFAEIIAAESRALADTLDESLREYADALKAGVALEVMRLVDLLTVARRRIESLPGLAVPSVSADESLWVRVDSYALSQVFATLAEALRDEHGVTRVGLRGVAHGAFAEVDLDWGGAEVARDALDRWEVRPIQVGTEQTPVTIRHVLERHGGEAWHQRAAGAADAFRFLLPLAEPVTVRAPRRQVAAGRPEFYDFDLFRIADSARGLLGQGLAGLSYTVFDTETTGVEPSAGDRIISMGAVRIVNGRLLKQEVYEQLVDPQRSVPRDSIRIHGIQPAYLAGQPRLAQVLPVFHAFCEDTVLVAHNAAFDMRFLELAEAESGIRFGQPVLDTLLLSAVVNPNQSDQSLEAIAERLGVQVVGRHTALGDALVTGEIFLKLVALLAEKGVTTLGQALEASRETYYVRLRY